MTPEQKKNVQIAQKVLLDLLIILDETCKKHNLEYWVDGGTLLGATRDKKFIPWDDDLDICLLPDDHDKLITILQTKVIPQSKELLLYSNHRPFPHWSEYFGSFNVLKSENFPYKVDILKIKSIPNTPEAIANDQSIVNLASAFMRFRYKNKSAITEDHRKEFFESGFFLFRRKRFINFFNKYVTSQNKKDKTHLYNYPYNDLYVLKNREYYSYDDIFPLQKIEFEGLKIMAPNNIDRYLSILYTKDYLNPPPKNQQLPAAKKITENTTPIALLKANMFIRYGLKEIKNAIKLFILKQID